MKNDLELRSSDLRGHTVVTADSLMGSGKAEERYDHGRRRG